MPTTPSRSPWAPLREEEVIWEDRAADGDPVEVGAERFVSGVFRRRDAKGVYDPRFVSVSSNDTTAKGLFDKLEQGTNVTLSEVNDGSDEKVRIEVTSTLPPATAVGQVLMSLDGTSFATARPLTSCSGWLVNDQGCLLVVG